MFKGISRNRIIIYLFYLFLIGGLFLLYLKPKPGLFLELYAFHSDFLNIVMKGLTSLGSGLTAVVLVLLLFLLKIRYGFYIGLSAAVSGIVTQLLKIFVFPGHHRPVKYFSDLGISLDTVSGVHIHFYHSFPSGHTTTAFAIWFGLSFIVKNMFLKIILFILAVAIGYSRIYLAQHFPEDIIGGAVIGGLAAMLFYNYVGSWEKDWLNRPLISVIRR